jgi:hypothetical protein
MSFFEFHTRPFLRPAFCVLMGLGLTACGDDLSDTFGYSKNAPDEFAVVKKAPLIIPPDFSLRPPLEGKTAVRKQAASDRVHETLTGKPNLSGLSAGERDLINKAGAQSASDNIRENINAEGRTVVQKDPELVNRLIESTGGTE